MRSQALLMIRMPGSREGYFREVQRYAPENWYRWGGKAKTHWLRKRYPGAEAVCDGNPITPRFFYP